jgi:hypothetical protein
MSPCHCEDKQYCEVKLRDAKWVELGTNRRGLFVSCTTLVVTPAALYTAYSYNSDNIPATLDFQQ